MKVSTPLLAICAVFTSVNAIDVGFHKCNADGCLRALLPTRDAARFTSGALFCATYIAAIPTRTDVSGLPPSATKSCGSDPKRLSSACSCIPILPTPTISV